MVKKIGLFTLVQEKIDHLPDGSRRTTHIKNWQNDEILAGPFKNWLCVKNCPKMSISGPFHSTRFEIIKLSQVGCSIFRERLRIFRENLQFFDRKFWNVWHYQLFLFDFKLSKFNPTWIDRAAVFDSISATGYTKLNQIQQALCKKNDKTPLLLPEKASDEYFDLFFIIHKKVHVRKIASSPQISSNAIISYSSK